jgi:hypothetical protein
VSVAIRASFNERIWRGPAPHPGTFAPRFAGDPYYSGVALSDMRKCEIKHDDRLWILPGDRMENGQTIHGRTKNRRDHMVPLTDAAMEVVSKAISLARESEFVFPSPVRDGRVGHINGEAVSMAMRRNQVASSSCPATPLGVPETGLDELDLS